MCGAVIMVYVFRNLVYIVAVRRLFLTLQCRSSSGLYSCSALKAVAPSGTCRFSGTGLEFRKRLGVLRVWTLLIRWEPANRGLDFRAI